MAGCLGITVEPVLFLYMFSTFMLHPALQDLIYTKVCLEDYSTGVCDNLYAKENAGALDAVQAGASHWVLGSTMFMALPSILTAQYLGSWSDTYGRKIPMLVPPVGAMFASLLYIVMSARLYQTQVGLVVLGSLLTGLCGGFTSCIMTCTSYIAQASSYKSRTVRVGLLESTIYVGGTLGPLVGGWVRALAGRAAAFTIILACHGVIVIYIIVCVRNILPRNAPGTSWVRSGCTCRHLKDSTVTLLKSRQENRRTYLLWLLAANAIIMICSAGEIDISYIYVMDKPIEMTFESYTWYFSLKYGLGAVALVVVLPLCRRLPDMVLAVMGTLSKMAGLVILGLASSSTLVFVSAAVSVLSTWPVSIGRSAMSKLVEPDEQGKVFGCGAVLENVCLLVATGTFNSLYPATRHLFHGFTFFMAAAALLLPLIVLCVLHGALKRFSRYECVELAEEARDERGDSSSEDEEQCEDGFSSPASPSNPPLCLTHDTPREQQDEEQGPGDVQGPSET